MGADGQADAAAKRILAQKGTTEYRIVIASQANDTIKQAAAIAAWHSKARAAGIVPVSCTEAKNVSKPRGAKPGSVCIKREKTIKVRPALPDGQKEIGS